MAGTLPGRLAAATLCCAVAATASAQAGGEILIGASLPLSGANAEAGQETLAVAQAAFDAVNAAGGIQGRKLRLLALDDGFVPQRAVDNVRQLHEQGITALFNCWGTASCSAVHPLVQALRLPLVTGIAGAGPMHATPGRYVFNLRPTTDDEIARMVEQMLTIGQRRIAVVHQDDAFGEAGLAAAQRVLARQGVTPVATVTLARDGSNAAAVLDALRQATPHSAVVVAGSSPTSLLIREARQAGLATQFYNLAAQAHRKFVRDLGEHTSGVIFTTLVPHPWNAGLPIVRDYQQALKLAGRPPELSYLGLEVYLNARLLIEGLRKAGAAVTRESLVQALETMGERQFGPLTLQYGPGDRRGSSYVGLSMINRAGGFIP